MSVENNSVFGESLLTTAVILVAGVGRRLGPLTDSMPKCLLRLPDGRTILGRMLDALKNAGFSQLTLVVGHRKNQIKAYLDKRDDFECRFVENKEYRTTNTIVSAHLGLSGLDGEALMLNGDNLFNLEILKNLLSAKGDIINLVCRKPSYDAEDVKVICDGNRIVSIGKDLDIGSADGESIGINLFRGGGLSKLQSCLDRMLGDKSTHRFFYEAAFQRMIDGGFAISHVSCGATDFFEIDTPDDFKSICKDAWPDVPWLSESKPA